MKTIVITLSKTFPKGHPREGQPTDFKEKFLSGLKIHTVRENSLHWKKQIRKVMSGEAVLSVRQWSGKPYHSKQEEIRRLTAEDGVGFSDIEIDRGKKAWVFYDFLKVDPLQDINELAKNDGLSIDDFEGWFPSSDFRGLLIHFTNKRYSVNGGFNNLKELN